MALFNSFWGMQPWSNYSSYAPRNIQGPMGWGQQHASFSPYRPSGMYPYASPFGFSSPFMSYGSGLSYLMPTTRQSEPQGADGQRLLRPYNPNSGADYPFLRRTQGEPSGQQSMGMFGSLLNRLMAPVGGMYPGFGGQASPPYGSFPGMFPGFGLKPPGAPYDVNPVGEVVSSKPSTPAPAPAPAPAAPPQSTRWSPYVGAMLPVDTSGNLIMENGSVPGITDNRQLAKIHRARRMNSLWYGFDDDSSAY